MGIGGTGMRCIESLIHLCAMGMFDDTEIHLLALDTDKNNGNFSRLKEVKEAYVNAKNLDKANRTPLTETFFSADIKYYEFSPNYEKKSTFNDVFIVAKTKCADFQNEMCGFIPQRGASDSEHDMLLIVKHYVCVAR